MGRYYGKCPNCNKTISFRDEHTDWAKFLDEEYERGYQDGRPSLEYTQLQEDNLILAKELSTLLSRPEVKGLIEKDKLEEKSFIKDYILEQERTVEKNNEKAVPS